jgi:uncharacterized protein YcbK (DUF882 family)
MRSPAHETGDAPGISRRGFLTAALGALPVLAMPQLLLADASATRALRFLHTHTCEKLTVEYFSAGRYLPDALASVDHLLRDFRTGDVHVIEPSLLDLLHQVAHATQSTEPFKVISGYRSPLTNAALRTRSEGVAAGSLHMRGQAIDISLADVPLAKLRDAARALHGGGVGYYPASNFVHMDVGRVRTW